MNRRKLLSSLGAGMIGVAALPSWAIAWSPNKLNGVKLPLSILENEILIDIVETIIPETDTPGAKTLEVPIFIKTMIEDVYIEKDRQRFQISLSKINNLGKSLFGNNYKESSTEQKIHLLKGLELSSDQDLKWFFYTTKRLTIQGYTSSEYFMMKIAKFEFAPARYYGCIPITQ